MIHVARRVLGAFVVLAIVAGATLALSSRPRLDSDRSAVERNWRAVKGGLGGRYDLVDALARRIGAAGGPSNPIVGQVDTAFSRWRALDDNAPVATAITVANTLEGLARRLAATVAGSPILQGDASVTSALQQVKDSRIPAAGVDALNTAIAKYEKDRGGPVRRLAAGPLGFDAIPRLTPATGL
jgi:hypothetical protein